MTHAIILAGGTGQRMNAESGIPKQFLKLHGKPIMVYALEHFQQHSGIDNIIVVCLAEMFSQMERYLSFYEITKVKKIVPNGETRFHSIFSGLTELNKVAAADDIVLIHDGVRPMITGTLISANIAGVKEHGNAITSEPVSESIVVSADGKMVQMVPDRSTVYAAKAPQSFYFGEIFKLYQTAVQDGVVTIDSCHLMGHYGKKTWLVPSSPNNIKITTPTDFYVFRALCDAMEDQQIFGM